MLLDVKSEQILPLSQTPLMSAAQYKSALHSNPSGISARAHSFNNSHTLKDSHENTIAGDLYKSNETATKYCQKLSALYVEVKVMKTFKS